VVTASTQPAWSTVPIEETRAGAWESSPGALEESLSGWLRANSNDLPCVLFEAKPSLEIVAVSHNIADLLGVDTMSVLHQRGFLERCVAAEDRCMFQEKIGELENSGAVSFVHRFLQASGLPVWVSHSLRKTERNGEAVIRGCLVPIYGASRLLALDQEVLSRFIHKLGNQFQLLNLVIASLHSSLPKSRESEVLQESLDKAIELTRVLSDCNQVPEWLSEVQLLEVMRAAAASRAHEFASAGVHLETNFDAITEDALVLSSPYLLEAAFGHILQNALDATTSGGTVEFGGRLDLNGSPALASLHIKDTGCGINPAEQEQMASAFFSTKKGRDGLGLTVACRFVEMHGGALRINSLEGEGTEIRILLPLEKRGDAFCA
jgi:light-regulated signal transduction histidine kinase (bacteriophytochrome)